MSEDLDRHIFELGFPRWRDVANCRTISHFYNPRSRHGVYVLGFANGERYVGRANDVTRRFLQHRITHPDIVSLTFKPVAEAEIAEEERRCIHALERCGLKLRNLAEMSVVSGPRAFDEVVTPAEQESWLTGANREVDDSARPVDADLQRRLRTRFNGFLQRKHAAEALQFLGTYLATVVPYPNRTEHTFWAVSCLPLTRDTYTRLNINMQEVLTLWVDSGRLWVSIHLARSPYEREFGALWKVQLATSQLAFTEHSYKPGGGDQFELVVDPDQALQILKDPIAIEAMSTLNLRLMRKGPNYWSTSHCADLVTAAYDALNK